MTHNPAALGKAAAVAELLAAKAAAVAELLAACTLLGLPDGTKRATVTSYVVAHLRDVTMGQAITEYLNRIDATLDPYGGRFIVHGAEPESLEGAWTGDLVVVAFPSRQQARDWYHSPGYQAIRPLRTGNSGGDVIIVDGVEPQHRATDILS